MRTLSQMYHNLDLENQAVDIARERVILAGSLYRESDLRLAQALVELGDMANSADLADEAFKNLSEAESILNQARDMSSPTRAKLDAQLAYHYYSTAGDTVRALTYAEQAIELLRPRGPAYDLAFALFVKATASVNAGHVEAAEAASVEALSLAAAMKNGQINYLLPLIYAQLGYAQTELAKFADAESN